jgi:DNA-binding NtrC family response regulator
MANILVVDDEVGIRELLSEILRDEGHDVIVAENATEARIAREVKRPDLVLLDIWMPDTDGITLLKEWSANGQLNMPVIMMSGHASIETAVEATKIGALDFLEKPIGMQKLLAGVKRGLERTARPAATGLSLAASCSAAATAISPNWLPAPCTRRARPGSTSLLIPTRCRWTPCRRPTAAYCMQRKSGA